MSQPSDTPETDAAEQRQKVINQGIPDKEWPWYAIQSGFDFARELERQRDVAHEDARRLALAIKEGGLPAAAECKLNATFHIRTMKEALAAHEALTAKN